MELLLSGQMTVAEVNRIFQKQFPYLKLEFYCYDTIPEQLSLGNNCLSGATRLGEIVGGFNPLNIDFDPTDSVTEFEKKIESQLVLHVRVFQNINGIWYQTPRTGHLKLNKQNALGIRPFTYSYNKNTLFL